MLREKLASKKIQWTVDVSLSVLHTLVIHKGFQKTLSRSNRTVASLSLIFLMLGLLLTQAFHPFNASAQTAPDPAIAARTAGIETEGDLAHLYVTNGPDKKIILTEPAATLDARSAGSVAVAPDGQKLVYVKAGNENATGSAIWMVNYDGTNPHQLTAFPAQQLWTAPFVWSPDSKQLAYVIITPEGQLELWRMNSDGIGREPVLKNSASFKREIFLGNNRDVVSWTPDGKFLEYIDRTSTPQHKYSIDLSNNQVASVDVAVVKAKASNKLNLPLFSQEDPRWKDYSLGGCGTTIGAQGCALTSTAMVFKYYGVDTDPKQLRNCLGYSACPMRWGSASGNCSGGKVSGGEIRSFDFNAMRASLEQGFPVIVGFSIWTARTHFVVVNGGSGTDPNGYTVIDPWDATDYKTLGEFIGRQGWPQQMNIFTGTPPAQATAEVITPGQGTSRLTQFVDAYNRAGGLPKMSSPTNAAHWWYGVVIQDFTGDPVAIMQDEDSEHRQGLFPGTCRAFTIHRGIFDWYAANGNPSRFGPATSDEYTWNGAPQQSFREGFIRFGSPTGFTAWPTDGDGWRREFYNNKSLGCGPAWVDYLAGGMQLTTTGDAAGLLPALLKDSWSARYSRTEVVPAGNYTLTAANTAGIKVWLDDTLVLDQSGPTGGQWKGPLVAGAHRLKFEFTGVSDPAALNFNLSLDPENR
ncbi:MAG: hypothetical protein JWP00_1088 [Chloroflexi bacterium]|nr:hypothetical protein [Chloroflexota bacterium]